MAVLKKLSLLLPILLSACMNFSAFIANVPTYFGHLSKQADIAYGSEPWQKLDVYTTSEKSTASKPVIVFFYGGRWESGSKDYYRFVASRFVDAGYVVVIPDYVKYPQAKFPAFVEDGARAVAWVEKNISSYGGAPNQLYIMGHSAGAHLGALLVSDPHYLNDAGSSTTHIAAFAGLAGPYAFTPNEPDLIDIFGPPERFPEMQVPTFITGHEPSMLLLWGKEDDVVGLINITRTEEAIHAKGGSVKKKIYPGMDHIGIIANVARSDDPVVNDCIAFFRQHSVK